MKNKIDNSLNKGAKPPFKSDDLYSNQFDFVIQQKIKLDNSILTYDDLIGFFASLSCHYWIILHDKDFDENGEVKTPHFHVVSRFSCQFRKSTLINKISKYLNIPSNVVSVAKCQVLTKSIRYLTHLDFKNKYQYDLKDIKSNDYSTLICSYTFSKEDLTAGDLIVVCQLRLSVSQLLQIIGLRNYSRYRNVINDLRQEFSSKSLNSQNEIGSLNGSSIQSLISMVSSLLEQR